MSVFLPAAFLPGLTGRMYAQFALVIAATALLSAINAATLKPTQAAMWLRPAVPPERRNIFYRAFNGAYGRIERWYASLIAGMAPQCADDGLGDRAHRRHRVRVLAGSDRLPADRGPRLYDRTGAIARWLIARAHTEGIGSGLRTQPQDCGGCPGDHHCWSVAARQQRPAVECRCRLYLVEGLERARQG